MVSHELRSPLNAILGYARILRSGRPDKELIEKAVAVIERNAKAQLQIVEDLLDSARIVQGKLRIELGSTSLPPLLEAALDTVRSAAAVKRITLIAHIDQAPEEILADPTRLQQVVWNLLSNGVKFTPEGGRVELRTESDPDQVRIIVSDNGKGVDPAFLLSSSIASGRPIQPAPGKPPGRSGAVARQAPGRVTWRDDHGYERRHWARLDLYRHIAASRAGLDRVGARGDNARSTNALCLGPHSVAGRRDRPWLSTINTRRARF